jgi:hypothetical protein
MRIRGSRLGWVLAALYVLGFVAEYLHAMANRGIFLYDLGLNILALPYIVIVGRLLLQDPLFSVHAHEPWGLVPAILFCSALVWLVGAGLEGLVRRVFQRPDPKGPDSPS